MPHCQPAAGGDASPQEKARALKNLSLSCTLDAFRHLDERV
jgi:hypothetical protein